MLTEKRSLDNAPTTVAQPVTCRSPHWTRCLSRWVAGIATLFTIFGFSIAALVERLDRGQEVYLRDDTYTVRGLPEPTAESLELKNTDSRDILLLYLKLRDSHDPEDREAIESYFRRSSSEKTASPRRRPNPTS